MACELHNCSKTTENDFMERKIFYMIACSLRALLNAFMKEKLVFNVEVWRERIVRWFNDSCLNSFDAFLVMFQTFLGQISRFWGFAVFMLTVFRLNEAKSK